MLLRRNPNWQTRGNPLETRQPIEPTLDPAAGYVPAAELSDAMLMQRYAKGNGAAFDMLYARHKDALYRYLLRGCNTHDTAAALFQDIWQQLIDARTSYKPTAPFSTYLFTLAHNRLVNFFRRKRITPVLAPEAYAPPEDLPDAQLGQPQRAQALMASISRLPFDQREAILLKEEGGFSLDEIASITGVARETVNSRLRHALAKLREESDND